MQMQAEALTLPTSNPSNLQKDRCSQLKQHTDSIEAEINRNQQRLRELQAGTDKVRPTNVLRWV